MPENRVPPCGQFVGPEQMQHAAFVPARWRIMITGMMIPSVCVRSVARTQWAMIHITPGVAGPLNC